MLFRAMWSCQVSDSRYAAQNCFIAIQFPWLENLILMPTRKTDQFCEVYVQIIISDQSLNYKKPISLLHTDPAKY